VAPPKLKILRKIAKRAVRATASTAGRFRKSPEGQLPATVVFIGPDGAEVGSGVIGTPTTLLDVSKGVGVDLDHFCGGQCSCGTCRVTVVSGAENLSPMVGTEEMTLGASGIAKNQRLACQAFVHGSITVRIPRWF
jgi:ferredoxin